MTTNGAPRDTAVIWDFDGTLVDSHRKNLQVNRAIIHRLTGRRAASFTALGYGNWAPEPQGWAGRVLGAGESFMGVFMMALFLVTFTRKMTR